MKAPRDILLARHQAIEPKLDAIRHSAVAAIGERGISTDRVHKRRSPTVAAMFWRILWRELIFPSRRIWAGLAAVWILIFAVNFSIRDNSHIVARKSPPAAEMIMAWRQQQRLLAELNGSPASPADAERQKTFLPKPRTERMEMLTA
jgi:hypothetical protein